MVRSPVQSHHGLHRTDQRHLLIAQRLQSPDDTRGVGGEFGGVQSGLEGVADAADHEFVGAGVPLDLVQVGGDLVGGAVGMVQPAVDGLAFLGVVGVGVDFLGRGQRAGLPSRDVKPPV